METRKTNLLLPILLIASALVVGGVFLFRDLNPTGTSPQITDNQQSVPLPSASPRQITMEEVGSHSDANSCWLVIEGKVYDVTSFIPSHPGMEAILQGCGKDATEMFNSRPNLGTSHSDRARSNLPGLQIGIAAK